MKDLTISGRHTGFYGRYLALVLCCLLLILSLPCGYGDAIADDQQTSRNIDSGPALANSEKAPGWSYNSDYIYSISRTVRDSSLPEAGKVPLFIPSIVVETYCINMSPRIIT